MLATLTAFAGDNLWQFDPTLQAIYKQILSLQIDEARQQLALVRNGNELHKLYLLNLSETADILITEDEKRFDKINDGMRARLDQLSEMPETAETLFLRAEISLQRGFNLLNLGQELNAVLAIRQAYLNAQECVKKYPQFIPVKKTHGVIQVMLGSVPDKYQWFMNLLGMKGSVKVGQKQLDDLRASNSSLSLEATLLFYTIKGFLNQQFGEAARGFQESLQKDPDSRLLMFLGINMLMKNSQSEEAFELMQHLDKHPQGLQMVYVDYLRGEALLHRGDYTAAISYYQKFIRGYKSRSFKKDAYYKISLCYYLLGDMATARKNFETAKATGRTASDPDKYADAMLADNTFPHAKILKIRFFTDGGYYKEARDVVKTVGPADLHNPKDAAEFAYRKGRLAHKTQDLPTAKTLYLQAIEKTGDNPWYFAPNAALQLGYIAQSQGDVTGARKYYEKALSYKRYEYKNGIDSKAKFALEQLGK
ncbi:MAG: tetratricopeptide repeat protein [Cyclobacteriaceae bacterium]|nr:tetratricopeptide repeat protein [Cyclobacteriaceae bacterium]